MLKTAASSVHQSETTVSPTTPSGNISATLAARGIRSRFGTEGATQSRNWASLGTLRPPYRIADTDTALTSSTHPRLFATSISRRLSIIAFSPKAVLEALAQDLAISRCFVPKVTPRFQKSGPIRRGTPPLHPLARGGCKPPPSWGDRGNRSLARVRGGLSRPSHPWLHSCSLTAGLAYLERGPLGGCSYKVN